VFWRQFEQRLLERGEAIGHDADSGIVKFGGRPPSGSVAEIAIRVFRIPPRGCRGSQDGLMGGPTMVNVGEQFTALSTRSDDQVRELRRRGRSTRAKHSHIRPPAEPNQLLDRPLPSSVTS